MIVEGGSASWNACSIGYTRLKREFQLGVNGRYEISGGLKRNALSTAIQITRIGLADISGLSFSPFFKKKKRILFKRAIYSSLCPFPPVSCDIKGAHPADSHDLRSRVQSPTHARTHARTRVRIVSSSGINPGIFDRYGENFIFKIPYGYA